MSIKSFLLKKMLKAQGVPEEQADMMLNMMEKNPKLFQKIALEVQEKIKSGMDQQAASIEVMKKHEKELKELMPV